MTAINCVECGSEVDTGFSYCPECGAEVEFDRCPDCDAAIAPDADACPECGSRFDVVYRGPDVEDAEEAIGALDDDARAYLTEAVRRDPDLIEAWAQLVGIARDPEEPADGQPQYVTSIRSILDDTDGKSVEQVTEDLHEAYVEDRDHPITDHADVPEALDAGWVRDQLDELVDRGAIGCYRTRNGEARYVGTVGAALDEEMSLSGDKTLEDVDRVVEETGMNRAVVLRRNMNAQFTDLVVE